MLTGEMRLEPPVFPLIEPKNQDHESAEMEAKL